VAANRERVPRGSNAAPATSPSSLQAKIQPAARPIGWTADYLPSQMQAEPDSPAAERRISFLRSSHYMVPFAVSAWPSRRLAPTVAPTPTTPPGAKQRQWLVAEPLPLLSTIQAACPSRGHADGQLRHPQRPFRATFRVLKQQVVFNFTVTVQFGILANKHPNRGATHDESYQRDDQPHEKRSRLIAHDLTVSRDKQQPDKEKGSD